MLMKAKSLIKNKIYEISRQIESDPSDIKKQSEILVSLQENIDRLE